MYHRGVAAIVPRLVSTNTVGWSPLAQSTFYRSAFSSSAPSANEIEYFPLLVPTTCTVRRMWWANGASVSASYNIDAGIYADGGYKPGVRLVSTGSTAQGTATQVQFADVTDTVLAPGLYWLAIVTSNSSATLFRVNIDGAGQANRACMFYQYSVAAPPLPATATPAEAGNNLVILFGFATTASP